jgi:hypothetical protein
LQQITVRSFKQPKLLADGTLVYEKTGWERPVPPAGYKAKSNDRDSPDAWVLVPIWPRCVDRKFSNNMKPCGCVNVVQVCNSREASTYLQIVTPDVCEQCPLRRTQP